MSRSMIFAAAAAALFAGGAQAAAPTPLAWIITPGEGACTTELELSGRASLVPVTLASDGQVIALRFAKEELPERAFLPIRVDQKRYSSLMLGKPQSGSGELILSEEAEIAMRRGKTLAIAWLGVEPLSGSLAGSEQGLNDLKICGAQASSQARTARDAAARVKAESEERARVQAVADAQVQAARAQQAAAEAERKRIAAAAERQRREEAEAREVAYRQQRAREYEQARLEAEEDARERAWYEAEQRRRWEADQAARYVPYPYNPQRVYRRRW